MAAYNWAEVQSRMLLTVVVVNWNSRDDLEGCLLSLERQTHRDLEVIVVDNGSTDGSVELLGRRFPQATLVTECQNLGFAEACNRAIAKSHGAWTATLTTPRPRVQRQARVPV